MSWVGLFFFSICCNECLDLFGVCQFVELCWIVLLEIGDLFVLLWMVELLYIFLVGDGVVMFGLWYVVVVECFVVYFGQYCLFDVEFEFCLGYFCGLGYLV